MSRRLAPVPALLATLVVLSAPRMLAAQDPVREHVIVTGTATPVPFAELGRAVFVLTREQIARLPVRSVAELLAYVASVDVRSRGAAGVQSDFSIRGASFGQALVLVDGIRLNDAQSGHHNGDIPVLLSDVERIELLAGPGASLYGADAFGGAINVITRRDTRSREASVSAGGDGFVDGQVRLDLPAGGRTHTVGAALSRSDGFMFDREFRTVALSGRVQADARTSIAVAHLDKAFGANGFYGASPSKEWTTQTLASASRDLGEVGGWKANARAFYRTHGDRFLWDVRRPGQFENRHRTHATGASLDGSRELSDSARLHVGLEGGGDWIRSSNLGRRRFARGSARAELHQRLGARVAATTGLRFDGYSDFGHAWSPSMAVSAWVAAPLRLRAGAGHAFRVPTFTELYYSDPAHLARPDLEPERGWTFEGGADWLPAPGLIASATVFARRDRDVIDWVRDRPTERWWTTNVHRVRTEGLELSARRVFGAGNVIDVQYTRLWSDADPVARLSKYVLDYARDRAVASASLRLPAQVDVGGRLGVTRRVDGRRYSLVDLRLARTFGPVRAFVEGTNLLDEEYQEIRGVDMPGRWARAGLEILRF